MAVGGVKKSERTANGGGRGKEVRTGFCPEVYSAYINMKNQWVNEHTCFRAPKLPPLIAQTIDLTTC